MSESDQRWKDVRRILESDPISRICHTTLLFPWLAFCAGVLTLALSYQINTSHLPIGYGYAERINWGLFYIVVAPLLYVLGRQANVSLAKAMLHLYMSRVISPAQPVLFPAKEDLVKQRPEFARAFSAAMGNLSRPMWLIPLVIAIVFTVVDTAEVYLAFVDDDPGNYNFFVDWAHAYTVPGGPSKPANIAFDLLAYSLQFTVTFMGIHYGVRFICYLAVLLSIAPDRAVRQEGSVSRARSVLLKLRLIGPEAGHLADYRYHVFVGDKPRGLNPLRHSFNAYLTILACFGAFMVAHRIQDYRGGYVWSLGDDVSTILNGSFFEHGRLLDLDLGQWGMLVLWGAVVSVVAYYPMLRWRVFILDKVDALNAEVGYLRSRLDEAQKAWAGDSETRLRLQDFAHEYAQGVANLREVGRMSVWPNGDRAAFCFFVVVAFQTVAFVFPALAPPGLLALGIGLPAGLLLSSLARRTEKRVMETAGASVGIQPGSGESVNITYRMRNVYMTTEDKSVDIKVGGDVMAPLTVGNSNWLENVKVRISQSKTSGDSQLESVAGQLEQLLGLLEKRQIPEMEEPERKEALELVEELNEKLLVKKLASAKAIWAGLKDMLSKFSTANLTTLVAGLSESISNLWAKA